MYVKGYDIQIYESHVKERGQAYPGKCIGKNMD